MKPLRPALIAEAVLRDPRPVVLALAGGGCSPALFEGFQFPGVCWVPLDWYADGASTDPEAVADRLGQALAQRAGPTGLAGPSLGGVIALLTACRHADRVQALMVSNTGPRIVGHGDPSLPDRVRHDWSAVNQQAFLASCFMRPPPASLWATLCEYLAGLDRERLLESLIGVRRIDLSAELAAIRCPALIAHGRHDRRRPVESAQALAEGIRAARLALLPAGHTPMVDCAEDYRREVARFLSDIGFIQGVQP